MRPLLGTFGAKAFCRNNSLAGLLDDAWKATGVRQVHALALLDLAVVQAAGLDDPGAGFFAHLSRALLADGRPVEGRCADLDIATALVSRMQNKRARRLVEIAEATLFVASPGAPEQGLDRFRAIALASEGATDDPDDFFVLHGRALAAMRLGRPCDVLSPLYAAVMLAGRTGHHGRRWTATATLAEQLLLNEQPDEALELLEPMVREFSSVDADDRIRAVVHQHIARAKIMCGHAEDALTELLLQSRAPPWSMHAPLACALYESLTAACFALGQHGEAQRHLAQATRLARELADAATLAACHLHAARLAAVRHQMRSAGKAAKQALDCLARSPYLAISLALSIDAERLLAESQAACGEFEDALQSHRRHVDAYDRRAVYLQQARMDSLRARHAVLTGLNLTARELDCLRLCAIGKTASEIGEALGISEWTAVYHLDRIKKRFGLSKRHQMVIRAMSLGLIAA
jgi:DNA-binding CsgD family transcriptional regulator